MSALVAVPLASFGGNELAEDLGAAVGGVAGGVGGNAGAAAGAVGGKYIVRELNDQVERAIDRHFDAKDQDFVNRTGSTINYPDRTIKPSSSGSKPQAKESR